MTQLVEAIFKSNIVHTSAVHHLLGLLLRLLKLDQI